MPGGEELAMMEFTTLLLRQTFEGMLQAIYQQREDNAQWMRLSKLTPEAYAQQHVSEENVEEKLLQLFGGKEGGEGSRVDVGQPYSPARGEAKESPEIFKLLGVLLEEGDYTPLSLSSPLERPLPSRRFLISESGAQRLREAARQKLALEALEQLQRLVAFGLPEVHIESGRILSKASFRIEYKADGSEKMMVRALSTSNPGMIRIKAGMSGEIEVNFKVGRSSTHG